MKVAAGAILGLAALFSLDVYGASPLVQSVDSVGIPVSDAERSIKFYSEVLGFQQRASHEVQGDAYDHLFGEFGVHLRVVRMELGAESIDLMQFRSPAGRPLPADFRSNDRMFEHICVVVSDMQKAYASLVNNHVSIASPSPQTLPSWNPNAGGISAFYFKDPDGNIVEILHFPAGKGASQWHQESSTLFLGIDHTAIVIAHTEDSLKYYRDFLGLKVTGQSDNYGTEQERLNNVFGARLHITSLRVATGPGVELLEYVTPRTGRPYPADTSASDHWQWVVNMRTELHAQFDSVAKLGEQTWISASPAHLEGGELGFRHAFMLRDPDGHADNLILPNLTDH